MSISLEYQDLLDTIDRIDPKKDYTLQEILKEHLIPHVESHTTLYGLITERVDTGKELRFATTLKKKGTSIIRVVRIDPARLKVELPDSKKHNNFGWKVKGESLIEFLSRPYLANRLYYYQGKGYRKREVMKLLNILPTSETKLFNHLSFERGVL